MKNVKRKALIIGVNGQDGRLLFDLLLGLDYRLVGVDIQTLRTSQIKWNKKINIGKKDDIFELVKKIKPAEIYYLAAFHHSSQDKDIDLYEDFKNSYQTNVLSFLNFLEAVRLFSPETKIFYASSSLIFGDSQEDRQNEQTPFNPNSSYGITKLDGLMLGRIYREKYKIFVASGILYNHESAYRPEKFVSMKIIKEALRISRGEQHKLVVGNLEASVDWGYAPDYVRAMVAILSLKIPEDFIIATGKLHTVLDFIKISFSYLGLDWRSAVCEDKNIILDSKKALMGDYRKLQNKTGWKPSINFSEMIKKIIDQLK